MTDSAADRAFTRYKSRHAVAWTLCNVQRLAGAASATSMGQPLAGRTAIVVGAGYSLTRNGPQLREAQARGAVILGTNSSDPILRHYGVRADAIVVRESIDNSAEVTASEAPLVCVDVAAHPAMWTAAGERLAWFVSGYPRHFGVSQRIGVRPLFGGSAAFTSAVALARTWGAARIVLVGADLGMESVDGELRPYHPASPRGDLRGTLDGDMVHFDGNEHNDAICEASGQRPPPAHCSIVHLPAHDYGGTLPALDTLNDQRDWLQIEAGRHGHRLDLLNATEGGAGIVGWRNATLADVVSRIEPTEPVRFEAVCPVDERTQAMLTAELRAEAQHLADMSDAMLAPGGPRFEAIGAARGAFTGAPLAESLAAWKIVDTPRGDGLVATRYAYEAYRAAAGEAGDILNRASA